MFPIPSLAFPKIHFQSEKLFVPKHKKTQKQKNMSNLQIFDLMFPIKMEVAPELLKNGEKQDKQLSSSRNKDFFSLSPSVNNEEQTKIISKEEWKKNELKKSLHDHQEKKMINVFLEKEKRKDLLRLFMHEELIKKKSHSSFLKPSSNLNSEKTPSFNEIESKLSFTINSRRKSSAQILEKGEKEEETTSKEIEDLEKTFEIAINNLIENVPKKISEKVKFISNIWKFFSEATNTKIKSLEEEINNLKNDLSSKKFLDNEEPIELNSLQIKNRYLEIENKNKEEEIIQIKKRIVFLEQRETTKKTLFEKYEDNIKEQNKMLYQMMQENNNLKLLIRHHEKSNNVETSTNDLIIIKNNYTDTSDLENKHLVSKEIQTLYSDEIDVHEDPDIINRHIESVKSFKLLQQKSEKYSDNFHSFSFSNDFLSTIEKLSGFEELTLTKVSQGFLNDLQNLFDDLDFFFTRNKEKLLSLNLTPYNPVEILRMVEENRFKSEQFIKNIKYRDKNKTMELNQSKMDLIEFKLELNELNKSSLEKTNQFIQLKEKFKQFFHYLIKIDEESNPSSSCLENIKNFEDDSQIVSLTNITKNESNSPKTIKKRMSLKLPSFDSKRNSLININIQKSESSNKLAVPPNENIKKIKNFNRYKSIASPSLHLDTIDETIFEPSPNLNKENLKISTPLAGISEIGDFIKSADLNNYENSKNLEKFNSKKTDPFDENVIKLINEVNSCLPHQKVWAKIDSPVQDKCAAFLLRIEASKLQTGRSVSLKTVLKALIQIEILVIKLYHQDKTKKLNPLIYTLYEFFFEKYNKSREETENKITKVMQGCLNYLNLPRVNMFAKLLNVIPDKQYIHDGEDVQKYFSLLVQLDDNPMIHLPGLMLAMSPQEHVYIGMNKAIDFIHKFCINSTNFGHVSKNKGETYIEEIKKNKIDDPMVFRRYVVDVDFVISKIFDLQDYIFEDYHLIFNAVDLDNDQTINFKEFLMLTRCIERNYKENDLVQIFNDEFDFYDNENNEHNMSFRKFTNICLKKNLCAPIKQEFFFRKCIDDIKNFEQLKEIFDLKKNLIKLKLIKTNNFDSIYRIILKKIEADCYNKKISEKEGKLAFVRYRLVDEESNSYMLTFETENLVPSEFNVMKKL